MKTLALRLILPLLIVAVAATALAGAVAVEQIDSGERCPVCGMFVAKYPQWVAQIHPESGTPLFFDGVKDMLAYYFAPQEYGGDGELSAAELWVLDYYTMGYIDGRQAHYVVGSDVLGPMGHEFVPFADRAAAENFLADHQGKEILRFGEISPERVSAMRQMHKMKMQ